MGLMLFNLEPAEKSPSLYHRESKSSTNNRLFSGITIDRLVPQIDINTHNWGLPFNLPLADPYISVLGDIGILLGAVSC